MLRFKHMKNFYRDEKSGNGRDFGGRDFRKRDFKGRGDRREMFHAVCAECGKDCEIPFEPRDDRPVYCSECFEKRDGGPKRPRDFGGRDNREPRRPHFDREDRPRPPHENEQLKDISLKLDRLLEIISSNSLKEEKLVETKEKKVKTEDKKKTKVVKKKASAKK